MAVLQVNRLSGLYLWAALILLFGLWIPETFLTYATFQGVLAEQAVAVILALGVLVSLSAGQFDLSSAQTLGVAAVRSFCIQLLPVLAPSWPGSTFT